MDKKITVEELAWSVKSTEDQWEFAYGNTVTLKRSRLDAHAMAHLMYTIRFPCFLLSSERKWQENPSLSFG